MPMKMSTPSLTVVVFLTLLSTTGLRAAAGARDQPSPAAAAAKRAVEKGAAPAEAKTSGMLIPGEPVEGRLHRGLPAYSDGSYFETWTYEGDAGEELHLKMNSGDLDAFLVVEGPDGATIREIDDAPGSTDAVGQVVLPRSGTYAIHATSYGGGEIGRYRLLVVTTAPRQAAAAPRFGGNGDPSARYALIVGIADYPGEGDDLPSVAGDVELIEGLVRDSLGFPADNVLVLTDAQATRRNVIDGILSHLGAAGEDGIAFLYYSGHGTQLDGNQGLTDEVDHEPDGRDEALYLYDGALLDDEVGHVLGRLRARNVLIAFDSCFAGTGTRGELIPKSVPGGRVPLPESFEELAGGAGAAKANARELLRNPEDHILLAASAEDQLSWLAPDLGASAFTYYLVRALREDSSRKSATFAQLMEQVRRRTENYVRDSQGERQTPQAEGTRVNESVAAYLGYR